MHNSDFFGEMKLLTIRSPRILRQGASSRYGVKPYCGSSVVAVHAEREATRSAVCSDRLEPFVPKLCRGTPKAP